MEKVAESTDDSMQHGVDGDTLHMLRLRVISFCDHSQQFDNESDNC